MINRCIHLKQKLNRSLYCDYDKKIINISLCNNCKHKDVERKEYKQYKKMEAKTPIKNRTKKQTKLEKDRFSILTTNMNKCVECGKSFERSDLNYHEIFFGSAKRQLSIKYGLVIPLYWREYHNQIESKGIHFNKELCLKWQIKGQLKWMEYYDKTEEDFIKVFGRSYLDK